LTANSRISPSASDAIPKEAEYDPVLFTIIYSVPIAGQPVADEVRGISVYPEPALITSVARLPLAPNAISTSLALVVVIEPEVTVVLPLGTVALAEPSVPEK
jgi:hypothetical protein